ncbi:phosphopantetheine-binding protein [Embleya hyalina]|uniref:Non-ribosomal peptide synthetase n=1 Tax=Embleya hyalina TaxID=516124 RepID=A0A401Z624_9ACTN|nr:phosphopantetheine-binding protein [Embleya hyalina]GCE02297.1 non-ribosomal peptide synthetase [Embleya hyalina]
MEPRTDPNAADAAADSMTPPRLRETVAAVIGTDPDNLRGDQNLVLLGLGSLEMMRLVNQWRRLGLRVAFQDLAAQPTLDAWWQRIDAARRAATEDTHPADREAGR